MDSEVLHGDQAKPPINRAGGLQYGDDGYPRWTQRFMGHLRRILISPYSTTFAGKSLILMCGFVNSIVLARWLGTSGRGELAAATLWPTLLIYLGSLGLLEATLYYSAQDKQAINRVFTGAIIFTLLLSITVILLGYWLLPTFLAAQSSSVVELSRASLLLIPFGMLVVHISNVLRAQMRIASYNALQLIIPLGLVLGALVLVRVGSLTVTTAVVLQLGLFIGAAGIGLLLLIAYGLYTRPEFDFGVIRTMLNYGVRVYVGNLFSAANLRLDQVLLASLVSPAQLGLYVVAVKVAEIPAILGTIVQVVAEPRIARLQDVNDQVSTLTRIFRRFWAANLGLKAIYILVIGSLIPLLYGNEFYGAISVAAVLVVGSVFLDAKQVLNGATQALNAPWLGSRAEIGAVVANVALLAILLPSNGIMGAAIASVLAYGIGMSLILYGLYQQFNVKPTLLLRVGGGTLSTSSSDKMT